MRLRLIVIKEWIAREKSTAIWILVLAPLVAFLLLKGFPITREPVTGQLVRYGALSSRQANGEIAWVDLKDGRTIIAYPDISKPYIAPGAEVKMQELTDLWGFRWYIIDHQATSQLTDTP